VNISKYFKKIIIIKKNHKVTRDRSLLLPSMIYMVLENKDHIEQNWRKLWPIWAQKQNYDWFDKNWDQKYILTLFLLSLSLLILLFLLF